MMETQPPIGEELPLLTDIVAVDDNPSELPTLTEIIAPDTSESAAEIMQELPAAQGISEADMQRLLDVFAAQLETVISDKLSRYLEDLHRQAVKLTILELKSELPDLLRESLLAQAHNKPSTSSGN
jgi:hypothetical protein